MQVAETKRLFISKFTLADAPFFLKLVNSPNWIRYIGDRKVKTIKAAEAYLSNGSLKSYEENGFGFYKLQLKESGLLIGTCGLIKRKELDDVDLGFAMLAEHEGRGYGFESSMAILDLAKNKFKLNRILAITLPVNKNSIKLIEKLGMVFEQAVRPFEDDEELLLFAIDL